MAGSAGFGGVQRHFHPARHPGLRADPAGEERPEGTAPLTPPGSGERPSSPSAPFFPPPPGPGHHQSRPHEEDPAGHQGAQQPALGWRQHRGGPGTPLPPVCVCVEPPRLPCFVCLSPSAPGAAASHRAHGAGGTGAELWSLLATGVAGSLQEPGSWAAVWGQKQRFSSPPPSTSLSPDGYLSCVNIWRRDIYCCCWRGVIASGKEGGGGKRDPSSSPQEPHTPFYKKYTIVY